MRSQLRFSAIVQFFFPYRPFVTERRVPLGAGCVHPSFISICTGPLDLLRRLFVFCAQSGHEQWIFPFLKMPKHLTYPYSPSVSRKRRFFLFALVYVLYLLFPLCLWIIFLLLLLSYHLRGYDSLNRPLSHQAARRVFSAKGNSPSRTRSSVSCMSNSLQRTICVSRAGSDWPLYHL